MRFLSRRAIAIAIAVACPGAGPGRAAAPLPVADGVYCGPGNDTITIDSGRDLAKIAGYSCGYPIIAADKLQSDQCRKPGQSPGRREFDLRPLDQTLYYNQVPYSWCRPLS